jgi:hypothetical protein
MILSEETLKYPAECDCIDGEGQQYSAGYFSVSSDNIILYKYVLMEKDNNKLLDILALLLTISYCTGME